MKKLIRILLCSTFICSLFAYPISVQGVLRDANNRAVEDGTYSMQFLIYNQETGGSSVWSSSTMDIGVLNGVYSETIDIDTNIANSANLWLEIAIDNETMSRVKLHLSPYEQSIVAGDTNVFPDAESVGIGTTSPSSKLHVYNDVNADPSSSDNSITKESAAIQISGGGTGTDMYLGVGAGGEYTWIQSQHDNGAYPYHLSLNPVGGNVGIGYYDPSYKLAVAGDIYSSAVIRAKTLKADANNLTLQASGTNKYVNVYVTNPNYGLLVRSSNGNGEYLNIRNNGDNSYIQPDAGNLYVMGPNANNEGVGNSMLLTGWHAYHRSNNHYFQNAYADNTTSIYINGTLHYSSDSRLKYDVQDLSDGLDVIRKLNLKQYKKVGSTTAERKDGIKEVGVFAQDLLEIPELSHAVKLEDGTIDENVYYVNYQELYMYSIAAVKELDNKVSELENTIQLLENKINNILND